MMYLFFELAATIAECLITIMFLTEFFGYKNSNYMVVKSLIGVCGLFFIAHFVTKIESLEATAPVFFALFSIIFCLIFLKEGTCLKVLLPIGMVMGIALINLSIIYSFSLITGNYRIPEQDYEHYSRIICLVFSKLLYFFLSKFVLSTKNKEYRFTKTEWISISIFFIISFFISVILWKISIESNSENLVYYLVFYCGIIFLNIFLYYLLLTLNIKHIESSNNAQQIQKLSSQKITIESIRNQYEETRSLKHDISNLLNSIAMLAEKGYIEELLKSIKNISNEKLNNKNYTIFTNVSLIDAVINTKYSACKKKNIEFECNITADLKSLNETDISIILSNLFDNAIEYSETIPNGKIILTVSKTDGFIQLNMKNRINEPILIMNPKLKTTKKDVENHGIGIKSITNIVKNLGGEIRFSDIDNYFNIDIFIRS